MTTGRRVWYAIAALLLAVVFLVGLAVGLAGLAWSDTHVSRIGTSIYVLIGLQALTWAVVLVVATVKALGFVALHRARPRLMLGLFGLVVGLAVAYCILLYVTNAGEWSLAPVG